MALLTGMTCRIVLCQKDGEDIEATVTCLRHPALLTDDEGPQVPKLVFFAGKLWFAVGAWNEGVNGAPDRRRYHEIPEAQFV